MDKRKAIVACIVVFLLGVGAAWALGYIGDDPALAELQHMREQMSDDDLSDAHRQRLRDEFRARMDGLSEAQRDAFRDRGREQWQEQAQRRMDEFFELPPADQKKRLDDMIDRMVERQKERQKNPNANNGGGQGRGNGGGRNMTQAQRDQRAKERIARTDPKSRAQRDVFRQMMGDRMKQRGISPPPDGGRGPWGGGRI